MDTIPLTVQTVTSGLESNVRMALAAVVVCLATTHSQSTTAAFSLSTISIWPIHFALNYLRSVNYCLNYLLDHLKPETRKSTQIKIGNQSLFSFILVISFASGGKKRTKFITQPKSFEEKHGKMFCSQSRRPQATTIRNP